MKYVALVFIFPMNCVTFMSIIPMKYVTLYEKAQPKFAISLLHFNTYFKREKNEDSSMFRASKYLRHGQRYKYNKINKFLCKLIHSNFEKLPRVNKEFKYSFLFKLHFTDQRIAIS